VRLITGPVDLDTASLSAAVECDGLFWSQTTQEGETTQGGSTTHVKGAAALEDEIGGLTFSISPEAFFQTNT
jgi:23S rRNA (uracil1939-C5)-methyltransferase